ncbi:unnamed protein product [Caenorhabditis brenneri]
MWFLLLSSYSIFLCHAEFQPGPSALNDPLWPLVPDHKDLEGRRRVIHFVSYVRWNNWKKGESVDVPGYCTSERFATWPNDEDYHWKDHFYWRCAESKVNGSVNFEPSSCIGDLTDPQNSKIEVGQSRKYVNDSIVVYCDMFNGRIQRVSEPIYGCFHNGTVFKPGQTWREFTPGRSVHKRMECYRAESGYYEVKLSGCEWDDEKCSHSIPFKSLLYYPYGSFAKCIETENGNVELKFVDESEDTCELDGVIQKQGGWLDERRGANLKCYYGKVEKSSCQIGKTLIWVNNEVKLSNGCTFLCHPQTNIYKCDNLLLGFSILDKLSKTTTVKTSLNF